MERFYKITKSDADLIGYFEYSVNEAIDPFVGEQKDGSVLISEKMYLILKEHSKIKQIDFSTKELVEKDILDTKEIIITK